MVVLHKGVSCEPGRPSSNSTPANMHSVVSSTVFSDSAPHLQYANNFEPFHKPVVKITGDNVQGTT